MSVFEAAHPITLPYYDNRMCEFICTVPEAYLADRKLQIAHLQQDKALVKITWQAQKPFNLNTYQFNKSPFNLPFRIASKLKRELQAAFGNPLIQRNFELQFLGVTNEKYLESYLFKDSFYDFIPQEVVRDSYTRFKNGDGVSFAHAVSMLLTLSLWHKHFYLK